MATQTQIQANQLNAQKSTGPRTADGKSIASKNSLKHGLFALSDVISGENQADFNIHREQILTELNPISPLESILADRVVCLSWRLKRSVRIQNQAFNVMLEPTPPNPLAKLALKLTGQSQPEPDPDPSLALGRAAIKDLSNARVLERLLMYERRIENSLFKTILELQRLSLIRNLHPADKPTHNHLCHSEQPVARSSFYCEGGSEESHTPPDQKSNINPIVSSRSSEYLAPSSTGGPKIENPHPRATSHEPRAPSHDSAKRTQFSIHGPALRSVSEEGSCATQIGRAHV
jgi:hypothetical protein